MISNKIWYKSWQISYKCRKHLFFLSGKQLIFLVLVFSCIPFTFFSLNKILPWNLMSLTWCLKSYWNVFCLVFFILLQKIKIKTLKSCYSISLHDWWLRELIQEFVFNFYISNESTILGNYFTSPNPWAMLYLTEI